MGSNAHQVSKYFSNSNCYFSRMRLKAHCLIYWKHMSINYFLMEVLHLADALILEHFHKGNTPIFQLWLIDSTEKICICYSSHLAYWNNVIMEQFLQENVLLRHLLYFKSFLDSCWGVTWTPLAQNSKKNLIKEYLDWTRPSQWGKRTFFRHRLYVWTS